MNQCNMNVIKYANFAFNGVFALSGLTILIAGIVILINISDYKHFVEGSIFSPPILLIIAGVIVFAVAFLGCFGAAKESPKILYAFAGCLIFIFVLELIAGIIAAVYRSDLEMALQGHLKNSLSNYATNNGDKMAWDHVQQTFQCCGVDSPSDWLVGTAPQRMMPLSCCHALKEGDPEPTESQCRQAIPSDNYVYQEGCYSKLYDQLDTAATSLVWFGVGVALIQLVGVGLALWLAFTIKMQDGEK